MVPSKPPVTHTTRVTKIRLSAHWNEAATLRTAAIALTGRERRAVALLPNRALIDQGGSAALRRGPAPRRALPWEARPARTGPERAAGHLISPLIHRVSAS